MDTAADFLAKAKEDHGGAAGLADKLNNHNPKRKLTPQAISQWKRVPADRAADVEAVTGISCHQLRPDVFRTAGQAA